MSTVEEMIIASLKELAKIANEKDGKPTEQESRLLFPKYFCGKHADEKRISEQEERLLFIRELEKQNEFYYSIETPTSKLYKFSDKNKKECEPQIVSIAEGGQSASFDLTLYDENFTRKHFIEFKNGNVNTVKKDFLKLLCDENDKENYFVNIIECGDLLKRKTLESIKTKYQGAVDYVNKKIDNKEHTNSSLKIILFNINGSQLIQFKDICLWNNTKIEE
jgi:hypothetical protein